MQWTGEIFGNYKYQVPLIGFLIHKQLIFFIKRFHAKFILWFSITISKQSQIENLDPSKYNCQSLDSTCDKICVENGIFFYFNHDGKLDLYCILKRRYPIIKNNSPVILIECTEMNGNIRFKNLVYLNFLE